ncbi:hypothetical protein HYFRA_00011393 [Hymenoscyphus fraxineus]|uniref:Uncharacterized protein n=1 Tax=Hymenoscyphus fraxineus TaxID=746836 RepID=A0A9N9PX92_9HELO|nr:hypothetical protein HYFRA_00011393 [Hymenoscyphus fraxineus]
MCKSIITNYECGHVTTETLPCYRHGGTYRDVHAAYFPYARDMTEQDVSILQGHEEKPKKRVSRGLISRSWRLFLRYLYLSGLKL